MKIGLQVKGLDEMITRLKIFEEKLDLEITRQATLDGARVILEAMQLRAPVRVDARTPNSTSLEPGEMKSSLTIRMSRKKYGVFVAKIGPVGKIKGLVASVEYGHVLIRGGRRVKSGRASANLGGQVIGHVPAHPFLRPAIDESARGAIDAYGKTMMDLVREVLIK